MTILVTGAGGFIGRALVSSLLTDNDGPAITCVDVVPQPDDLVHPRVVWVRGGLDDGGTLDQASRAGPDCVYHLASVPGALAEADPALGRRVNLDASLDLFDRLAASPGRARVVYASSIAVYGAMSREPVGVATPTQPLITYGTHKRMVELALADHTRRGNLSGIALRLPGIVARPPSASGFGSAFMSDLIHALVSGRRYVCPVGPDATAWWLSVATVIENLRHAARLDVTGVVQVPALHHSVGEIIAAMTEVTDVKPEIAFEPDERIEGVFGNFPPLDIKRELALGFRHDVTTADLIRKAVAGSGVI
ncbi:NAD-dependent epimerase/dehydratase family protein [Oryzibacter oryziterrae]|uniref:NAD-dependent epimerase/dehydratase family protein n=1 Tax=Oryzibacter oryziterrae TaxID=2766474 RepID=UPI001F01DBCC|nr:NAD-dependent epimerase/dehydratase family protein [Oryzibacter oryziterrae]